MFPLRLRHDDAGAPVATAYVADAVPGAEGRHWCQIATHWAAHAHLPFFVKGAPPADDGAPSEVGAGSAYVLWSAQLIAQVDVDTIAAFKAAAQSFRPVAAPPPGSGAPLYCRYVLVRRADGGLVSGNAARALIGWAPLPPTAAPLTAAAARDREIAHDDAQFLVRAPVETHVAMAERLPDHFVLVRVPGRYFSIRFGAIVVTVGVPDPAARGGGAGGGGGGGGPLAAAAALPAAPGGVVGGGGAAAAPPLAFLADAEDGITLVTVAEPAPGGGWTVHEETPPAAEVALGGAGFFLHEGTNAASVELPRAQVVALLTAWGWAEIEPDDLA